MADYKNTISLDASQFNSAINDILDSLNKVAKTLTKINKERIDNPFDNDVNRKIKKTEDNLEDVDKQLKNINKTSSKTSSKLGGIFQIAGGTLLAGGLTKVAGAVGGIFKQMVSGNAEMETYKTQLTTLMGSAEGATERMEELKKFGLDTPFELTEIVKAEKILIGFGLQGQKALDLTGKSAEELRTVIGDVAAGTGQKFEDISLIMGKFSSGATGEAIARLQELGIVTKEQLSDMGVEFSKSGQLMSPLPVAMAAATDAMTEKFGGGMEDLSLTFEGRMSNLQDNVFNTLNEIGGPLFDILGDVVSTINEIFNNEAFKQGLESITKLIGALVKAILPIINALIDAIVPLITTISDALIPIFETLSEILTPIIQQVMDLLMPIIEALIKAIGPLIDQILKAVAPLIIIMLDALKPLVPIITDIIGMLVDAFVPILKQMEPYLKNVGILFTSLVGILAQVLKALMPILPLIIDLVMLGFKFMMTPLMLLSNLLVALVPTIEWLATALTDVASVIINVVVGAISGLVGWVTDLFNAVAGFFGLIEEGEKKAPERVGKSDISDNKNPLKKGDPLAVPDAIIIPATVKPDKKTLDNTKKEVVKVYKSIVEDINKETAKINLGISKDLLNLEISKTKELLDLFKQKKTFKEEDFKDAEDNTLKLYQLQVEKLTGISNLQKNMVGEGFELLSNDQIQKIAEENLDSTLKNIERRRSAEIKRVNEELKGKKNLNEELLKLNEAFDSQKEALITKETLRIDTELKKQNKLYISASEKLSKEFNTLFGPSFTHPLVEGIMFLFNAMSELKPPTVLEESFDRIGEASKELITKFKGNIGESLNNALDIRQTAKDNIEALDEQKNKLLDDLNEQKISHEDYIEELKNLDEDYYDNLQTLKENSGWSVILSGLAETFQQFGEIIDEEMSSLIESFQKGGEGAATGVDVMVLSLVSLGSAMTQIALEGKLTWKSFALSVIDTLTALTPVFAAMILGQELATKGIAGLVSGPALVAILTATITLALQGARALIAAAFLEGGESPGGTGLSGLTSPGKKYFSINEDSKPEYIINAKSTAKYKGLLDAINEDKLNPSLQLKNIFGLNVSKDIYNDSMVVNELKGVNSRLDRVERAQLSSYNRQSVDIEMEPLKMSGNDMYTILKKSKRRSLKGF